MEKKTKIHLYIRGNCGNQFFQYSFARWMQEKTDGELIINYSKLRQADDKLPESDNLLQLFNVVPYKYQSRMGLHGYFFSFIKLIKRLGGYKDFEKRTYEFHLKCAKILPRFGIYYFDAAYYPFKIADCKNIYIIGYYECPKYFAEIDEKICKELTPKQPLLESNRELFEVITGTESVCVTIKRMDVNREDIADIYQYDISYFYRAMEYMTEKIKNPVFIIFSDDIEWCKENIKMNVPMYYETPGNPIWEKIRLMSSCKHFIIHNSTFSWWAQHLSANKDKIVVAPSKWMQRDDQPIDLYEDGWIYLTADGQFVSEHE
ncbi:alpha-1,2-fucosyltransferase [Butyrivibrio sp. YAB3001]|uniref:alpha-1,2-fucosyltransferase n=1 Tax=Butyrivibrio sp. YAB3001 TaxID=1520812 RepID=UPI0008F61F52|nr:alpha-1,2-fucosyltransferase [Butyrivibrio sp. YAB3001]SFC74219.1 Glycosyl transferase family 11 [Butyrivibrio sp. YAB3001]